MKIAILSHSYLEPENRKNIVALSRFEQVLAVSPSTGPVLVFEEYRFDRSDFARHLFLTFRPFYILPSQYLLATLTMGFAQFKPDVILVEYNPWSVMFLQALVCRALFCRRAKLVCSIKKNTYRRYPGWRGWAKDRLARIVLARVDHIMAVSAMVKRLYETVFLFPSERITVVHHLGVDIDRFAPSEARDNVDGDTLIVGYCGRFEVEKGVTDLIAAVEQCREAGRPVVLKLLGSGALEPQLARRASESVWLEIYPPVSNAEVADFLRGLDIFVMPSRVLADYQEHDAHALLEALAISVAVVGARSGIIPEILSDGAGLLVDPEVPGELAASLNDLAGDELRRQALGARGRRKAEQEFSLVRIAARKAEIFRGLLT